MGENGAGKSTLLDVIQGKIEPTRGRVKIGQTVRFGVLSQQLEELKPHMGDTIREVLGNYKKYYVIDGRRLRPRSSASVWALRRSSSGAASAIFRAASAVACRCC